jgi:hypothetical protein
LERIVNLDQFGMNDAVVDDDLIFLKTSVVATSFRFLEESERPVESDDTGKKKSKKRSKKTKKPKE